MHARPRKVKQVHTWRPRRACPGELVQWDTSMHAWLEERGAEKMYLIAGNDDATNALFARFVESDSTEHHMRVLWAYVERHGRPQALYTDKAGLFQPTLAPGWKTEAPGPKTETQMGVRSVSWGLSASRPIPRRPRDAWNAASEPYRIAW